MLGLSHLLISGTAASLLLETADPVVIVVAAMGGLLPDVDISTSPAGRLFPWISKYFEDTKIIFKLFYLLNINYNTFKRIFGSLKNFMNGFFLNFKNPEK